MKDIILHVLGALAIQVGITLLGWLFGVDPRIAATIGGAIGAGAFVAREAIQTQWKRQHQMKWVEALPPILPCAVLAALGWAFL